MGRAVGFAEGGGGVAEAETWGARLALWPAASAAVGDDVKRQAGVISQAEAFGPAGDGADGNPDSTRYGALRVASEPEGPEG